MSQGGQNGFFRHYALSLSLPHTHTHTHTHGPHPRETKDIIKILTVHMRVKQEDLEELDKNF